MLSHKKSLFIAILICVFIPVLGYAQASDDGFAFRSISGHIEFTYPSDWFVEETGGVVLVRDEDSPHANNQIRIGILRLSQLIGTDALNEDVAGRPVDANFLLQFLAGELEEVQANIERELGFNFPSLNATYTGEVTFGTYGGAQGTLGDAPIYILDVPPDNFMLIALNGSDQASLGRVLDFLLETMVISTPTFDSTAYTTPITPDNATQLSPVFTYQLLGTTIADMHISADQTTLYGVMGGKVHFIDISTGDVSQVFEVAGVPFINMAVSPNQRILALAGKMPHDENGYRSLGIYLLSSEDGELLLTIPTNTPGSTTIAHISFSLDGTLVAMGSSQLYIYDVFTGEQHTMPEQAASPFAFSPGGDHIVTRCVTGTRQIASCIYDLATREVVVQQTDSQEVFFNFREIVFTPDGQYVIQNTGYMGISGKYPLPVWSATETGEAVQLLMSDEAPQEHADIISTLTFSPDGTLLVSSDRGGELRLWDMITFQNVNIMPQIHGSSGGVITSVTFNASGTLMFTNAADNVIRVWAVQP